MKTEKLLLARNEAAIANLNEKIKHTLPYVVDMVNEFNALNIGSIKQNETLLSLSNASKTYYDHIEDLVQTPESNTPFPVDRLQFLKTLQLPSPESFYRSAEKLQSVLANHGPGIQFYEIVNGEAVISETAVEDYIESVSKYAESQDEMELMGLIDNLQRAFTAIDDKYFKITGKHPIREQGGFVNVHPHTTITNTFINCIHPDGSRGGNLQDKTVCAFQPKYDLVLQLKKDLKTRTEIA